ncbi:unnamed protein product [Blepharisma stoltei]|uniref:Uncharacterized protein n=1 Tax=Blepharisma stoltei TaxID=1481888 RepID=A0AAU9JZ19_9CILI|nr:unnamed protein product [Blepharisma stoltei]
MYQTFDFNDSLDHKKDLKFKEIAHYAKKPGSTKWFHDNSGLPYSTLMSHYKPTLPTTPQTKTHRNSSWDLLSPTNANFTHNYSQIIENKLKDSIGKSHPENQMGHCYKLTPKEAILKVEDALKYLKLREIGCSKQEAITFCSRDRCTHSVPEYELPARLRTNHSSRTLVNQENSKYKLYKSSMEVECFDSVNKAITNYLIAHRYEPEPYMNSYIEECHQDNLTELAKKENNEITILETEEFIDEANKLYNFKLPFRTLLEKIINKNTLEKIEISPKNSTVKNFDDFASERPLIRFSSIITPKKEPKKSSPEKMSFSQILHPQTIPKQTVNEQTDHNILIKSESSKSYELKLKQSRRDFLNMKNLEEKIKQNIINSKYELYEKICKKASQNDALIRKKQEKKQQIDEDMQKQLELKFEEIKEKMEKAKQERLKLKEGKKIKAKEYNKKHDQKVEELRVSKSIDLENRMKIMLKRQKSKF